jgi:predicted permease
MTTALCVAAGLLIRSYLEMKRFDPGFDTRNLVSVAVSLREPPYNTPQRRMLYCEQALERVRAIPGVRDVSVSSDGAVDRLPFPQNFGLEGAGESWASGQRIHLGIVSPNHLGLLNVPLLRGRNFGAHDRSGSEPVMLVNQAFVRKYFPDKEPLGQRIGLREDGGQWFTIIGIVSDRRNVGFREDYGPEGYLCAQQVAPRWASYHFFAWTQAYTAPLGAAIRNAVRAIDPDQPVSQPFTVESLLQRTVERNAGLMAAISAIGLFGLLLSLIGIYGVASYAVLERTHEIGVRVSLGATRRDIRQMILKRGLRLVMAGLAAGALVAIAISVGLEQLLFGIPKLDPVTYLGVGGMLAATALIASLVPAHRATRIKPIEALRYE